MADGKEGKVGTTITEGAITTDKKTYVKVAPDQECIKPLIPEEGPKEGAEPKVYFLNVIIEKGAIYNPNGRPGIYGNRISIGYGARIKGPIMGREDVTIDSGIGNLGPGIILGSIYSRERVQIRPAKKRMEDYKEGAVTIIGDIVAKSIKIEGRAIVKGHVVAEKDINIKGENVLIEGFIFSKTGKINLSGVSCGGIIAGNYPNENGEIGIGVNIGKKVSIFHPIIWIKNGNPEDAVKIDGYVRILRKPCFDCYRSGLKGITNCKKYINGECKNFLYITKEDAIPFENGTLVTDTWRIAREEQADFDILGLNWLATFYSRKNESDYLDIFEKDSYGHYLTADSFQTKIEQKIEQKVFANPQAAAAYAEMEGTYRYKEKEVEVKYKFKEKQMEEDTKRAEMMLEHQRKVREQIMEKKEE